MLEKTESKEEEKKDSSFMMKRGASRGFNVFRMNSFAEAHRPKHFQQLDVQNGSQLYDLMKDYLAYDAESFKKSIVSHLEYTLAKTRFSIDYESCYQATSLSVRDRLIEVFNDTQIALTVENPKRAYYLSIEYLLGRVLQNSLLNMEVEDTVRKALMQLGMKLENVYEMENDPGLGNGGLGRLAACFLDSLATLNYPAWGYGIRYSFGIFKQEIMGGRQIEIPDYWLEGGNPWEVVRMDIRYRIQFYGNVVKRIEGGRERSRLENAENVLAIAHDYPIPGFDTFNTINLRLWKSAPCQEIHFGKFHDGDYYGSVDAKHKAEIITSVLYPNDSTPSGRELRLKQQFFFVSATIQDIIRRFKKKNKDFMDFPNKVAIQLNDTHPSLSIVELLRYLVDIEDFELNAAWSVVISTFSYTNHTVLPEALETWEVEMFGRLLPRHLELIYLINHFWIQKLRALYPDDPDRISRMSLIQEGFPKRIRMANLSIIGSHCVNGVAEVHSQILKEKIFKDFFDYDPTKFINVTNGVTPRRWIAAANPDLSKLYTDSLGSSEWKTDLRALRGLLKFADDAHFQQKWAKIKNKNKKQLASWLKRELGVTVSHTALFDIQVKRIHQYKRQLLFCLYILHRYRQIKQAKPVERKTFVPRVFLLGGKAAPGYHIAKKIIQFATSIQTLLDSDLETRGLISFTFIPNYNVSVAEKIVPASDLSEHISTAGTEASGTSNMKFQMNGGLIIGTLDGANIEIAEEVGIENMFIFGHTVDQIEEQRQRNKNISYEEYFCQDLRDVFQEIRQGLLGDPQEFHELLDSFTHNNDYYLVGSDFEAYAQAQEEADRVYQDQREWTRRSIVGSLKMSKFSTDRTISEYAKNIWKIKPFQVDNDIIEKQ